MRSLRAATSTLVVLVVLIGMQPVDAASSSAMDHFHAGRQAWLEADWERSVRQFTLALADSIEPERRADALSLRAEALVHLHDCARAAADVSALRDLGSFDATRTSRLERMLAECENHPASSRAVRALPLRVGVYAGVHRYDSGTRWYSTYGAELAFGPGPLQGFVRGGWIGRNDSAGELGMRLLAGSFHRLRPWVEGSAGLERLRPGGGIAITVTIPEWDSMTTTFGGPSSPEPTFDGTSFGLCRRRSAGPSLLRRRRGIPLAERPVEIRSCRDASRRRSRDRSLAVRALTSGDLRVARRRPRSGPALARPIG